MPMNDLTIGADVTIQIVTPTGPLRPRKLSNFKVKQETGSQKKVLMDGKVIHLEFPQGWSGSFEIEREDGALDLYFAQLEASYYSGQNLKGSTITRTIRNPDGSVTQLRYTEIVFKLDDAGESKGDDTVKQSVSFMASRCIGA